MSDKACCATIRKGDGYHIHRIPCSNLGKVERDGKWYCGVHDPAKGEKRQAEREAKWAATAKAQKRRREEQEAGRVFLRLREAGKKNYGALWDALREISRADVTDELLEADLPALSAAADKVIGGEG